MLTKSQIAVLYMVGSVICFSTMDILVKYLDNFPIPQLLFMRFFFGLIPIFFIIPREKIFTFYKTRRPALHAFSAVSVAVALIALFIALRNLPLADVISLTFAGPIFVTIFSIIFISEKVGTKRWSAVFIGFIGVLIVINPTNLKFGYIFILQILAAICLTMLDVITKGYKDTSNSLEIIYITSLLVTIGSGKSP